MKGPNRTLARAGAQGELTTWGAQGELTTRGAQGELTTRVPRESWPGQLPVSAVCHSQHQLSHPRSLGDDEQLLSTCMTQESSHCPCDP